MRARLRSSAVAARIAALALATAIAVGIAAGAAARPDEAAEPPALVVGSLRFEGAHAASRAELAQQIETAARPAWRFWAARPALSEEAAREDADRLARYYRTLGFFETRVELALRPRRDPRVVDVIFHIEEGPPILLARRSIEVPPVLAEGRPPDFFERDLPLVVGERFTLSSYQGAKREVSARAADAGHPLAEVTGGADVWVPRHEAALTWRIDPGPRVRFGPIRFEGLANVDAKLLEPEVTLREGEVYSLERMRETRDAIQSLGLFSSVVAQPRPAEARTLPDGDVVWPVDLTVAERPPRTLSLGLGWGSDEGPRAQASWLHRNFFGGARRFEATARYSGLERSFRVGLSQPNWLARRQTLDVQSWLGQETTPAYTAERMVAAIRVTRRIGPWWTVRGGPEVSWSSIGDATSEASRRLDDPDRTVFLSGLRLGVRRSTARSEIDPQSGSMVDLSAAPWLPGLGSERGFVSILLDARRYQPIRGTVLAGRFRIGTIEPFGGRAGEIPLTERFYLGGSTSVRGFHYWGLGPRGADGKATGGASLLEGALELRFPIRGALGGVAFVDTGSLELSPHRYTLGDLTYAVGAGIRFRTPLGPLRFDLAHALNPPAGSDTTFFHFSIGQAF